MSFSLVKNVYVHVTTQLISAHIVQERKKGKITTISLFGFLVRNADLDKAKHSEIWAWNANESGA